MIGATLGTRLRRHTQYALFRLGIRRAVHTFGRRGVRNITIVITDSLGDIAINTAITQELRRRQPEARITLLTHRKYAEAGELNPDYHRVLTYGPELVAVRPGHQTYRDELRMARALTPEMDLLLLCQPSAWCDAISARYPMLEMQRRVCGLGPEQSYLPRLVVPSEARARAAAVRAVHPGPAVFVAPAAFTFTIGPAAEEYYRQLTTWLADQGVWVFTNTTEPLIPHERCVPVGSLRLADATSLAGLCNGVVSTRSGLSDLIGFSNPTRAHYVLYPSGNYPYSRLSWLRWCSLADMGVTGVTERVNAFADTRDATDELLATMTWWRGIAHAKTDDRD